MSLSAQGSNPGLIDIRSDISLSVQGSNPGLIDSRSNNILRAQGLNPGLIEGGDIHRGSACSRRAQLQRQQEVVSQLAYLIADMAC